MRNQDKDPYLVAASDSDSDSEWNMKTGESVALK